MPFMDSSVSQIYQHSRSWPSWDSVTLMSVSQGDPSTWRISEEACGKRHRFCYDELNLKCVIVHSHVSISMHLRK